MSELENKDLKNGIRELSRSDDLGLKNLPDQVVKKQMQGGYVFNILLVGETGIGKSTLISSLFSIPHDVTTDTHTNSEVKLKSKAYDLYEKGVNLKLTIVETAGYGDQINRSGNAKPITSYIESQFEQYFQEELKLKRELQFYRDTRIHACLYLICPTGHNLKSVDLFCMKQLHDKVNIIPIVAKSDFLSKEELRKFKTAINAEIEKEKVKIYRFPTDDEEIVSINRKSNMHVPFAVTASGDYVGAGDTQTRARVFPWGTMFVENEDHSEFLILKQALIEVNMYDLREKTHIQFYENYRKMRMLQLGFPEFGKEANLKQFYQKKQEQHRKEMLEKEAKLKQKFIEREKIKEVELKKIEDAFQAKYNKLFENVKSEEQQIRHLKVTLEREILSFQNSLNRREEFKKIL